MARRRVDFPAFGNPTCIPVQNVPRLPFSQYIHAQLVNTPNLIQPWEKSRKQSFETTVEPHYNVPGVSQLPRFVPPVP